MGQKSIQFNPQRDIPSLQGKVILVTGGSAGLGQQSILEFSRHQPAKIWIAARNRDKAKLAMDDIQQQIPTAPIKILDLDLSSFASIKRAAATILEQSSRLDILMLNAGVMAVSPGLTDDGYEMQFGTNTVGHALLTKLLLPILTKTAALNGHTDVRIVSLTSHSHVYAPEGGIQFDTLKTPAEQLGAYPRYAQTKLANILWVRQMAKTYPQLTVCAVHPGVVRTNLMQRATHMPAIMRTAINVGHFLQLTSSIEKGVRNQLWASVSKEVESGAYYEPIGLTGLGSALVTNDELARKLWDWMDTELSPHAERPTD